VSGSSILAAVAAAAVEHFGQQPQRASVSYVGVEPIEVLRFEPVPGERVYLSLGMSRQPMTSAAETLLTESGPRAELMMHLRDPTDRFVEVWRRVAVLAAAPAVEGVVYLPEMTVDLGRALAAGTVATGVVVTESPLPDVATDAGSVTILQVVPAASTELAWCRLRGSDALRKRWAAADTDLLDLARDPVSFD
jgi:hypothetical protein